MSIRHKAVHDENSVCTALWSNYPKVAHQFLPIFLWLSVYNHVTTKLPQSLKKNKVKCYDAINKSIKIILHTSYSVNFVKLLSGMWHLPILMWIKVHHYQTTFIIL